MSGLKISEIYCLFPEFINGTLTRGIVSLATYTESVIIDSPACAAIMTVHFPVTTYFTVLCFVWFLFNVDGHKL